MDQLTSSGSWTQAQEAVIGSMLIDDGCIGAVMQRTSSAHFGDQTLRHVYEAIRTLWTERRSVDIVTVQSLLGDGYTLTLTRIVQQTPTSAHADAYVDVLDDCLRLSRFRAAALDILDAHSGADAQAVWDRLGRELMGTSRVRRVTLAEAVNRYLDRMNETTPPETYSLGIEPLDRLLHLGRGKFLILAADSSTGKTAMALQFAFHIAESGKKVGFFSLETDNDTLTDRLMAETQAAGIALPRSKQRSLTNEDFSRAIALGERAAGIGLELIDNAVTTDEIRAATIAAGYDVIVVDYLQLIDAEGEKRWDIVTRISMALHRMAQQLGVTVIGLSQVTPPEKGSKKSLTMDDLRESRQLKHDADVILILEPWEGVIHGRSLSIAKNKDGRRNQNMRLIFEPENMNFVPFSRTKHAALIKKTDPEPEDDDNPFTGGGLPL